MGRGTGKIVALASAMCLLASGMAVPGRAGEPTTITKSEIRSGEPQATHRHLRDVVWEMFEAQDYRRDPKPTRTLDTLPLQTKTHATGVPGLCRYDQVWIEFEKVSSREHGADAPVRASGLRSTSYFAFVRPPRGQWEEIYDPHAASAEECENLPKEQSFFDAKSDYEATNGYRAWLALLDAVHATPVFPLECKLLPREETNCRQLIAAFRPDQLESIETCDPDPNIFTFCYRLTVASRWIDVFVTGYSTSGPPGGQIAKVKLDSPIVIRDQVID